MSSDLLPSWRLGAARTALLELVRSVTEPGRSFVPPPGRMAIFGDDGALWCDKPRYARGDFSRRRWQDIDRYRPVREKRPLWRAVIEDDGVWLASIPDHIPGLTAGIRQADPGSPAEAFDNAVGAFFNAAGHPVIGLPDTRIAYRPMCELVALLEARQFHVYIRRAGHLEFVRVVSVEIRGTSRGRMVGSEIALDREPDQICAARSGEQPVDKDVGKLAQVWARMGSKPLLAFGNAHGDTAVLETAHFALMIYDDDAQREFASRGGAQQALAKADERGWTVVSIKDDFIEIF